MTGSVWTVRVVAGRAGAGERGLYLRARRRRADGKREERRASAGTDDPEKAERLRAAFEADLNQPAPVAPGLLEVLEAREDALRREAAPARSTTADGYRTARLALTTALSERFVPARAPLLRARDLLAASGRWLPETVNTFMRRAAAAWRWALERELVEGDWPALKRLKPGPSRRRPFAPHELAALLDWLRTYEGGKWLGLVTLVAATGRRVGAFCKARGRDLDPAAGTLRVVDKGGKVVVVPLPADVLALLPRDRAPEAWLFPARYGGSHVEPGSVLNAVRRGIAALGIPDGERLDVHSMRRAFATDSHRAAVPVDVARRATGHETVAMYHHYQREAGGDDIAAVYQAVADYRARAVDSARARNGPAAPSAEPVDARDGAAAPSASLAASSASPSSPVPSAVATAPSAGPTAPSAEPAGASSAAAAPSGDPCASQEGSAAPSTGFPAASESLPASSVSPFVSGAGGAASRAAPASPCPPHEEGGQEARKSWGYQDSNLRPRPYQGRALTN